MISEKIVNAVNTMKQLADEDRLTPCSFNRSCDRLIKLAEQVWQMEHSAGPVDPRPIAGDNVVSVDFQGKRDAAG